MTTQTLSQTDVGSLAKDFRRDGFVLVERLLDARQLSAARDGIEWSLANVGGPYKWIKQRSYEWHPQHPIFVELIEHPRVIAFVRDVLGDDFHLIAAQCSRNTKADPYSLGAMQIHQDACFFPAAGRMREGVAEDAYGLSAMFYLQDTPLEMGPTELVKGSSRPGASAHTEDELKAHPDRVWKQFITAGSLMFFNHRTWHRGANNNTDRPRDLITNAYARPEVDKSQITTKQPDGSEKYIPPEELLRDCSPMMRQLLRGR